MIGRNSYLLSLVVLGWQRRRLLRPRVVPQFVDGTSGSSGGKPHSF